LLTGSRVTPVRLAAVADLMACDFATVLAWSRPPFLAGVSHTLPPGQSPQGPPRRGLRRLGDALRRAARDRPFGRHGSHPWSPAQFDARRRHACAVAAAGRSGSPLVRFFPLQHIPAASRCPVLPASGRSRFGVMLCRAALSKVFPELRFGHSPLRFFAFASVRPSFGLEIRTPPARVMHRRFLAGRCSATRVSGRSRPGRGLPSRRRSWGCSPSQSCSCPRVSGVSAFRTHLPFPERPSRYFFVGRSAVKIFVYPLQ